jgi:hypothetical protein
LPAQRPPWRLWEDGYPVKSDSPEWDAAIAELAAEIKTRHYSRKTLKTYAHWSRQFQRLLNVECHDIVDGFSCQDIVDTHMFNVACN